MSSNTLAVLGDSFSAGWGDPDPNGGYRGWVPRFAEMMNLPANSVHNFAEYGSTTQYVVREQLPRAIRDKAPLIVVIVGVNDLLGNFRHFDDVNFRRNLHTIFDSLVGPSTIIATATYPDIPANLMISDDERRMLREHFAEANVIAEETADVFGVPCIDLHQTPALRDPKMWSNDRLHPSSTGHQYFADELFDVVTNVYGLYAA